MFIPSFPCRTGILRVQGPRGVSLLCDQTLFLSTPFVCVRSFLLKGEKAELKYI